MAWAGKQALRANFGDGRYNTVGSHAERFRHFATWCKEQKQIRDAAEITREDVEAFCRSLAEQVDAEDIKVSYAINLISSVNVTLNAMRGDDKLRVKPSSEVGSRNRTRRDPPAGLRQHDVRQCADRLREQGQARIAATIEVARAFGLRRREASMLNARAALGQAHKRGAINITAGTKGGRGHRVDRWVPVTPYTMNVLRRAADAQGKARNLIEPELSLKQWFSRLRHAWSSVRNDCGLKKIHDLRAAYACARYRELTGHAAPVVAGRRIADRHADNQARQTITVELGHGRVDVVASYIGGSK
ncbi:integrase domain-containing protein [Woeseia oceani]|nr:integrase domain-containing protein [Woeseia oceani]